MPGGVREMVGISLGIGCSGLKSHLVELVMRADMRLFGEAENTLFFCLCGQVWIMPCVEDGPTSPIALYNFTVAVLFKNSPRVCVREWEREREISSESQCKIALIHISVRVCLIEHPPPRSQNSEVVLCIRCLSKYSS